MAKLNWITAVLFCSATRIVSIVFATSITLHDLTQDHLASEEGYGFV